MEKVKLTIDDCLKLKTENVFRLSQKYVHSMRDKVEAGLDVDKALALGYIAGMAKGQAQVLEACADLEGEAFEIFKKAILSKAYNAPETADEFVLSTESGANYSYSDQYVSNLTITEYDLSDRSIMGRTFENCKFIRCNFRRSMVGNKFQNCVFEKCILDDAEFTACDIFDTRFIKCFCRRANFACANFIGTTFSDCNTDEMIVDGADFPEDMFSPAIPFDCPETGSFIGWKKIRLQLFPMHEKECKEYLVKLEIPEDAKRSSALGTTCRCSKAKVLSITNIYTEESLSEITGCLNCKYVVGEMVYPDSFDENRWNVYTHGIHFFMSEEEAAHY